MNEEENKIEHEEQEREKGEGEDGAEDEGDNGNPTFKREKLSEHISNLEEKLEDLNEQKHKLFLLLKVVLAEEEKKKQAELLEKRLLEQKRMEEAQRLETQRLEQLQLQLQQSKEAFTKESIPKSPQPAMATTSPRLYSGGSTASAPSMPTSSSYPSTHSPTSSAGTKSIPSTSSSSNYPASSYSSSSSSSSSYNKREPLIKELPPMRGSLYTSPFNIQNKRSPPHSQDIRSSTSSNNNANNSDRQYGHQPHTPLLMQPLPVGLTRMIPAAQALAMQLQQQGISMGLPLMSNAFAPTHHLRLNNHNVGRGRSSNVPSDPRNRPSARGRGMYGW